MVLTAKGNNKIEIAARLMDFKENGVVQYKNVLAIDHSQRIPQLIKADKGKELVVTALSVHIGAAMNNLNVKYAMNADQVVALSLAIIDQSHQDQLALEDIMIFLQQMVAGECGPIEFKMDIPKFFELFEVYREERWQALVAIRDEQHRNYRAMGMKREGNLTWGDLLHKTANLKK